MCVVDGGRSQFSGVGAKVGGRGGTVLVLSFAVVRGLHQAGLLNDQSCMYLSRRRLRRGQHQTHCHGCHAGVGMVALRQWRGRNRRALAHVLAWHSQWLCFWLVLFQA